jgi:adenosine deaminase
MPYTMMMEAVERGVNEARGLGVELHVIIDTIRHLGPEYARQTLLLHQNRPSRCVIGFGMGGDEAAIPADAFEETFSQARQAGLRTVVHCGESAGPESIWQSLGCLAPARILHGIRAVEDEELLSLLVEKRIPLDVCPTSNLCTGVVASLAEHPIRTLFDRGIRVTMNTDDPAMFGTNLNREYELLAEEFHFTAEELFQIAGEGFRASFMPEERKNRYLDALSRVWALYEQGWVV